ncbi:MAG: lysoplasmalogenase [Chitinophagales bacterium]|nr:lysoplasmalogenase [Chitinophagales bacterium]
MNRNRWIILYLIILILHLTGILLDNEMVQVITKPLLVAFLIFYFFLRTRVWNDVLKKWITAALFFSWLGDVVLMFQNDKQIFFLLGLSSFLIAQVFYILSFQIIRIREGVKNYWPFLLIVLIYYVALIVLLSPYLGKMGFPVRIYGMVISFMFLLALHLLYIKNKAAGRLMMNGALLFIISDSILAIDKFYVQFGAADLVIMLTYGLAQLLITDGTLKYIRKD